MLDKYLKFFRKSKLQKYIDKVVDEEVKKSREYGLEISKEDIDIEKNTLYNIFVDKVKPIEESNDKTYNQIIRGIHNELFQKLDKQLRYYFGISTGVKTKYNCHINSVVSRIMIDISNKRIIL